ncbi:MAG: NADP-dependent oxidoreductase [Steroidobacteraceae bacterium]
MRSITQQRFGGPEVLRVVETPRPQPLPTEVVVRVRAVGLNPIEAFIRSGAFPLLGAPPFVLGWDISGIVEEIVPGTSRFRVGDEVYGMPLFPRAAGGYAEYISAPSRQLALKPNNLDHVHAAALPLVGLTAWQSLVDIAKIARGQQVLIHGGGGGGVHVAIQIAKALGAHVIATASSAKREFVQSLGADEIIDYKTLDFVDEVRNVDAVLDVIGGEYAARSFRTLRPGGIYVTAVDRTSTTLPKQAAAAGVRFAGVAVEPDYIALERLNQLIEAGQLMPHVERTYPFEQVVEAHELLERGSTMGKLVLEV